MSCAFGGWIVGGAAKYLLDLKADDLRDIDILIPHRNWHKASRAIPVGTPSNTFGGFKFADHVSGCSIDVWPDDLDRFFAQSNVVPNYAINLETYMTIEWHGRVPLTKPT